jgi:hypothetical protein
MPPGHCAAQAAQPQPSPETATQPATHPAAATHSSPFRNPPDNDGESSGLDLENILDATGSDEDQADAPQTRQARSEPAANASNIQVNNPTPAALKEETTALDIYDCQKGRDTFCNEYKQVIHLNHFSRILTGYIHSWTGLSTMPIQLHGRMAEHISSRIPLQFHPFDLIRVSRNIILNCTCPSRLLWKEAGKSNCPELYLKPVLMLVKMLLLLPMTSKSARKCFIIILLQNRMTRY